MAETTADVRRDIELTRERMSTTLQQAREQAERQAGRARQSVAGAGDRGWRRRAAQPSRTDVKAAAATVAATRGASSKVGTVLDDVVANLVVGCTRRSSRASRPW